MKNHQKEPRKGKKFLNMPSYPGGKEELEKFIKENISYPEEALKKRIEGVVHIAFDVDHNGEISRERITHSVGYGCDEEALRIIRLLKFNPSYNKGVLVKKTMKFRIPFALGKQAPGISYNFVEKDTDDSNPSDEKSSDTESYGYTISF
jgi:TonB family protein